jgi:hypothetical protein
MTRSEGEVMSALLKEHRVTALAVVGGGFLVLVSIGGLVNPDDGPDGVDRWFWVITGVAELALLGGPWGLRQGVVKVWAAYALIVIGLISVASFWWLFFVPAVVAVAVLVAGVMRRGLERELRPT